MNYTMTNRAGKHSESATHESETVYMTEDDGAEKLGAINGKQHIPLMNEAESMGQTSVLFCTISKFLKPLNQSNFLFFLLWFTSSPFWFGIY